MKMIVAYGKNNCRASAKRAKKQRCATVCIQGISKLTRNDDANLKENTKKGQGQ